MRLPIDQRFTDERARYRLAFTCEDCVYFDAARARCSHGYPDACHRAAAFEPGAPAEPAFCKEFELA